MFVTSNVTWNAGMWSLAVRKGQSDGASSAKVEEIYQKAVVEPSAMGEAPPPAQFSMSSVSGTSVEAMGVTARLKYSNVV